MKDIHFKASQKTADCIKILQQRASSDLKEDDILNCAVESFYRKGARDQDDLLLEYIKAKRPPKTKARKSTKKLKTQIPEGAKDEKDLIADMLTMDD